ncbi:hypothetical protein LCGC14_2936810, partial [marine sediment metagenome]
EINDTRGHGEGDNFLRKASMRFKSILRNGDVIARRRYLEQELTKTEEHYGKARSAL